MGSHRVGVLRDTERGPVTATAHSEKITPCASNCVWTSVWQRKSSRHTDIERKKRERERVCVCVCERSPLVRSRKARL